MSYSTTDQSGNQSNSYGGGKSSSLPNIVGNSLQNSAKNIQGPMGPLIDTAGKNVNNIMDAAYRGGPPQLDLSGLFPQTPQQKVAESRAGGGILKLRNKPTFNPNPTPNPGIEPMPFPDFPIDGQPTPMPMPMPGPTPGYGGGKGIFQPIGGNPGYGGGKAMPMPSPHVMPPDYRSPGEFYEPFQEVMDKTPTNTYGKY